MKRNIRIKRPMWQQAAACAALIGIIGSAASCAVTVDDPGSPNSTNSTNSSNSSNSSDSGKLPASVAAKALATAEYPKLYSYPDENSGSEKFRSMYDKWSVGENDRRSAGRAAEKPRAFYETTMREFLSGADRSKVYSPLNVYFALSMLAETTGGESRAQILDLLGDSDIEQLREHAGKLWRANYRDDGLSSSVFANSAWLADGVSYNKSTIDILAKDYYASTFSGDLASSKMTALLREWLNAQTRGLLEGAVDGMELPPYTALALCSTAYFSAKWDMKFSKSNNDTRVFHSPDGDIEREFMNSTNEYGFYYCGDDFSAMPLHFEGGGNMWFILPDEDKTPDDVLASGQYLDMLLDPNNYQNQKQVVIHHSVPKFDVSSDTDLRDGLKALGVLNVFDSGKADFSPLTTEAAELAVGKAEHAARVVIDEEGCTAAAITAMAVCGEALPPDEEIYFVLDRPFIFAVMSDTGHPLFTGVVTEP